MAKKEFTQEDANSMIYKFSISTKGKNDIIEDFKEFLEKLAPSDKDYRHDKTWGEKNGQSHILSALIKPFLSVPIENNELLLGQWQQIVFIDFDSWPRERTIVVKIK